MLVIGNRFSLLIFFVYKEFFFIFLLVISIPSHLSPHFLSLPSATDNNGESWLLPFILLESLSFFGYPVKCVTIFFFKNTRYSTSVILYFLSILPFWVISFAFYFYFSLGRFWIGMGGHWVGGEGRLERWVYLIKWNKTDIYLLAHSICCWLGCDHYFYPCLEN